MARDLSRPLEALRKNMIARGKVLASANKACSGISSQNKRIQCVENKLKLKKPKSKKKK